MISDEASCEDDANRGPGMRDQGDTQSGADGDDDVGELDDDDAKADVGAVRTDWLIRVKRASDRAECDS